MANAIFPISGDLVDVAMFDNEGSTSAGPQSTNVLATNGNSPTAEDWTRHRPLIKRLYVDEDRTLKDVMAIMARDYGHKATPKMYKSRITKWGLDKNNKERDMASILRQKVQRDRLGKASSFRIRGRAVDINDVYRYFKRRGVATESEILARFAHASTSSDVSCSTPPPTHSSPSFEVPRSLLPPQELLLPEKLFFNIQSYFEGSFSSKRWIIDEAGDCVSTTKVGGDRRDLNEFFEYCMTSMLLVRNRLYVLARRSLSKACSLVPHILQAQQPQTLEYLLKLCLFSELYETLEVTALLIGYVSKMSTILLDENHPCGQMYRLLEKLEPNNLGGTATQAWQCILRMYGQTLGQLHPTTISSQADFMTSCGDHDPQSEEAGLRELVTKCEESMGRRHRCTLDILIGLANNLFRQARYSDAESIANDVISLAQEAGDSYSEISGLQIAALAQHKLLKVELAEENMGKAIELGSQPGPTSWSMSVMADLEATLRRMGLEKRADELEAELELMIEPDEIDEEG